VRGAARHEQARGGGDQRVVGHRVGIAGNAGAAQRGTVDVHGDDAGIRASG
jgi:hypothetical protein